MSSINANVRPPRTVVVKVPGPQGAAGTSNLGTVTVVNPDQNPTITASGTPRDRVYNFSLPRASTFAVGTVTAGANIDSAAVTNVGVNGDVVLDIVAPRATVDVGTTSAVNPDVNPSVANSGTDAAVVLDFSLPRAAAFSVDPVDVLNPDQSPAVTLTPDDGDYDIEFSLPRSPVVTVDTPASVLNPDQQPAVSSTTTDGDVEIAFDLPRAPAVTLGTITVVNPDENPDVSDSGADGDVVLDIDLPRAPTFAVGTVTTVGPSDPADATDVGTDGDIVIDFDLPRGEKGWGPTFALVVDGARRVLQVDDWVGGEGTKPATGDYVGASGLVSDIEDAVDIRGEQGPAGIGSLNDILDVNIEDVADAQFIRYDDDSSNWVNVLVNTDDVPEGLANLYYTDARADDRADGRIAVASITDLADVDEGSGFSDGDILVYDATFDAWVPGALDTDSVAEGSNLYYTNTRVDAQTATNRAPLYFVENVRTANYTLVLNDVAKVVAFNSASNLTLTVPTNASVAFPIGTVINVYRHGTGAVTIAGAGGVTVRNAGTIPSRFGERSLRKRGTNEWVLA